MKQGFLQVDLIEGKILKSMIIFMIPLLISNIFQQLYNAVDTVIVGHFLGDVSLAAIGACAPVYELLVGFGLGIGNGLGIVVAKCYGTGDENYLKKSVFGSVVIGVGVTVALMVISKVGLYPLLRLLQTPEDIIAEAYSYLSFVTMFVGVMFAYNLFAGLLRAIGNSVVPLLFLVFSSLLNIGLDILFIVGFGQGIRGAAVATVIAQGISAVLCLFYIVKCTPILIPGKEHVKVEGSLYKELLGQGLSMGLMLGIVSAGTVILQAGINQMGYRTIAGHTAARKIHGFCFMPFSALGVSLSTFVSQNRGAGKTERIRKGVRYAHLLSLVVSGILMLILMVGAPTLIWLLTGTKEAEVLRCGTWNLWINAPFYAVLGILLNLRNSLQGLGEKVVPLISSIIELLGKIVFTWIFIPLLGYLGVIICEPVIWFFMCAQLAWTYHKVMGEKKTERNYHEGRQI